MSITIICPLYNAEHYIIGLHNSLNMQKQVDIAEIRYVLTEGKDNTENILNKLNAEYKVVKKEDFSHSITREKEAFQANGEILVFITQDVIIKDELWLYNLTKDIKEGNCEAAFSRQICDNNTIEKYIRECNYPDKSRIVSKEDIGRLGLMTFFFSDAASAIKKEIFVGLNGYDGKDLIISEDMYIAHKIIINGYRIKYAAHSKVIHSHKFKLKELYNRYKDTGKFFKENSYLKQYGANESGFKLLKYVLKRSLEEKNFSVILNLIPNFAARFIGMKVGQLSKKV